MPRLTRHEVMLVKDALKAGETQTSIAKRFKCAQSAISKIKRGMSWTKINSASDQREIEYAHSLMIGGDIFKQALNMIEHMASDYVFHSRISDVHISFEDDDRKNIVIAWSVQSKKEHIEAHQIAIKEYNRSHKDEHLFCIVSQTPDEEYAEIRYELTRKV